MTKFNQDKFESDAKKLVTKYLNYKVDEKDVFIVWFSKIGANAKAMLSSDLDFHYFEITYFGEEGKYAVDVYDIAAMGQFNEEGIAMKMNDNQHFYSEISKDGSTSKVKVDADKVQVSVETKCPVCQEHHNIWGLTDAFDLRIREDILILTVRVLPSDTRFRKDVFKIKYCPFCGRKL
ncbi:hypothetical protein LFLT20_13570 [Limosilactobacillus fermentum]|nr:hypothetical protein LFLT20_13570 [Limosilactobacillus fermentum]